MTSTPVPIETPNSVFSDTNNDGKIDAMDLLTVISDWQKNVTPREDGP